MHRRLMVLPVLLLVLSMTAGCGSDDKKAQNSGAKAPETSAPAQGGTAQGGSPGGTSGSPEACPTKQEKRFAKTRFAADAGLAFGAFHRYIWKPYQAGTFKKGAPDRKKALVKAGAAGLFAVNRLNAARKLINADPKLCSALKAPVDKVWAAMSAMAGKLKSGEVDPTGLGSLSSAIDGLKSTAKEQTGTDIKDRNADVGG